MPPPTAPALAADAAADPLNGVDAPRFLGGGCPTVTSPAESIKIRQALKGSWTPRRGSMIPLEAEKALPKGPTAGPYRVAPLEKPKSSEALAQPKQPQFEQQEKSQEQHLEPKSERTALDEWLNYMLVSPLPPFFFLAAGVCALLLIDCWQLILFQSRPRLRRERGRHRDQFLRPCQNTVIKEVKKEPSKCGINLIVGRRAVVPYKLKLK